MRFYNKANILSINQKQNKDNGGCSYSKGNVFNYQLNFIHVIKKKSCESRTSLKLQVSNI